MNIYHVQAPNHVVAFSSLYSAKRYAKELISESPDYINVYTRGMGTKPYMQAEKTTSFKWQYLDTNLPNPTDITELHWQGGSFGRMNVPESTDTLTVDTFCQWRSIEKLCIEEVVQIFQDTCPEYNGFNATELSIHAESKPMQLTEWNIAREGSVCLYGKCPMGLLEEMKSNLMDICVDEFNTFENGDEDCTELIEFRAWWD